MPGACLGRCDPAPSSTLPVTVLKVLNEYHLREKRARRERARKKWTTIVLIWFGRSVSRPFMSFKKTQEFTTGAFRCSILILFREKMWFWSKKLFILLLIVVRTRSVSPLRVIRIKVTRDGSYGLVETGGTIGQAGSAGDAREQGARCG